MLIQEPIEGFYDSLRRHAEGLGEVTQPSLDERKLLRRAQRAEVLKVEYAGDGIVAQGSGYVCKAGSCAAFKRWGVQRLPNVGFFGLAFACGVDAQPA